MKFQLEKLRLLLGCGVWLVLWLTVNYGLMAAVNFVFIAGSL